MSKSLEKQKNQDDGLLKPGKKLVMDGVDFVNHSTTVLELKKVLGEIKDETGEDLYDMFYLFIKELKKKLAQKTGKRCEVNNLGGDRKIILFDK